VVSVVDEVLGVVVVVVVVVAVVVVVGVLVDDEVDEVVAIATKPSTTGFRVNSFEVVLLVLEILKICKVV